MRNNRINCVGTWVVLAVVGVVSGTLLANAPPIRPEPIPEPAPAPEAKPAAMRVKVVAHHDNKLSHMRLVVPMAIAKQLGIESSAKENANAGETSGAGTRTVVAGVSISAALMLGGIAFFRSSGGSKKKTLMLLLATASLTVGGIAATGHADIAVPREPKPTPSQKHFGLEIVVSGDAKEVQLHTAESQKRALDRAYKDSVARGVVGGLE